MGANGKNMGDWSVQDVQSWLDGIGLPVLKEQFLLNAIAGDDLLELTTEDLMSHVGATELQARKILSEVGKITGRRTNSMSSQPSQTTQLQPAPPPYNYNPAPQAAVGYAPQPAYAPPQPALTPSYSSASPVMSPAYSNAFSQGNGSQALRAPSASGLPQNVQMKTKSGGCCAANELPHAVVPSPLPNVPMESPKEPPLPGQVIVGYEVCRYKVGKLAGLKPGAHGAVWGLCVLFICCLLPLCWIPCVMPSCYGDYQRPLYGYPEEEGPQMSGTVSGFVTGGDENWKKTC